VKLHRWLKSHLFYELALSSGLAGLLPVSLHLLGFPLRSGFLYWNIFLAWIPYLSSLLMTALHQSSKYRRWWIVPAIIWLVFFPNAPYLVTDIGHMREIAPYAWGFNLGVLLLFAWIGLFLGVASLYEVHTLLRAQFGKTGGRLGVLILIVLGALGIYLGRVERWNSWDVLRHPHRLAENLFLLLQPRSHLGAYGFILVYAMLIFIAYLSFYAARTRPQPNEDGSLL
jgi:uncharacterized membrane protein